MRNSLLIGLVLSVVDDINENAVTQRTTTGQHDNWDVVYNRRRVVWINQVINFW